MIEVGIAAVEAVFDWKAYQREVFGIEYPEEDDKAVDENTENKEETVENVAAATAGVTP